MFGHLLRRFGRGMAIKIHLRINEINKLCLSSDIWIFCLRCLRCTWPIIAIQFCHKTSGFFNPDRAPLLLVATFQSVQFSLGQSLTCNCFQTEVKGSKTLLLESLCQYLQRVNSAMTGDPNHTLFFTVVLVNSANARARQADFRYFDVGMGSTCWSRS